jgi:hypothetical protein
MDWTTIFKINKQRKETMKKLTLNQKEYEYLLKNNPTFLTDKNVVIKNDTTNVLVQKTKRYLIDNTNVVNFKYLTRVV